MKQRTVRERPFEYLRRMKTNAPFPEETVRTWYLARAYVLDRLKNYSLSPYSDGHLHVVIEGDSPLMLSVLRHVALMAHYPNYVEADPLCQTPCRNRTVISLVSNKAAGDIVAGIEKEEYLCNLPSFCKCTVYGEETNEDSYVDIELEITRDPGTDPDCIRICEDDVALFQEGKNPDEIYSIDTSMAVFVGRSYELGAIVDNIPYEDIHNVGRYSQALDVFRKIILQDKKDIQLVTDDWKSNLTLVKNGLSSLYCADCFESRELAVKRTCPDYDRLSGKDRTAVWEKNIQALSVCEHGRWVVDKLIFGFRPMSGQQREEFERMFKVQRKAYCKKLKNNSVSPVHLDIRSHRDLRRVDPDNLKYDSFLMLAIPLILAKVRSML